MNSTPATQSYSISSLYVSNLHAEVTEAMLLEKFSTAGPVLSIKVCRDRLTSMSLGYAYVNFQQRADAERALGTMNFALIQGRPCRIVWSQPDPSIRKPGVGSIFIKNLDKSINEEALYDMFSVFGIILSCKIEMDDHGSKGYGFVEFKTEKAAHDSIKEVNGMLLLGKKVFVGRFMTQRERFEMMGDPAKKFANVYIENFGDALDDDKLHKLFEQYGSVSSCKVMTDENGKSRGFGFVSFDDYEAAQTAVDDLNNKEIEGHMILVGRVEKKAERVAEMKDRMKHERISSSQGVNLFVNNLDNTIDDEMLRKEFTQFGTVTSAKVMTDSGRSRGYGYVCFGSPEEATRAITEMNGHTLISRRLYVALYQSKEDRMPQLSQQYLQRNSGMRIAPPAAAAAGLTNQPHMAGGCYMQRMPQQGQRFYASSVAHIRPSPRWAQPRDVRGQTATAMMQLTAASAPQVRPVRQHMGQGQVRPVANIALPITGGASQGGILPSARPGMMVGMPGMMRTGALAQYKSNPAAHNPPTQMLAAQQQHKAVTGQELLTASMLYEAPPREQKEIMLESKELLKAKDYLKENQGPAELSRNGDVKNVCMDGGNDMVDVGGGFYLYKELYDKLYLHQRHGILFLHSLYKMGRGGVLGDDMGLGKTTQIVSYLAGMFHSGKIKIVLLIMPVAVIIHWSEEFENWAPLINVVEYHSQSQKDRARILKKFQKKGGVCLTSYGVLQNDSELLKQYTWDYVILDEGHKVKNPDNKTTMAAHVIAARNRIVISGTPLMNNLMELWAVFNWTHEGQLLGEMSTFGMEYHTPITRSRQKDANPTEQQNGAVLLDNLRNKIAPYFLRRVKGDIKRIESLGDGSAPLMPDLPRKNDLICWVYLSPTQQQIYKKFISSDEFRELLNMSHSPYAAIAVLKKICNHARLFTNRQCMELGLNFKDNVDVDALDEAIGNKNFNVDHVDDSDLIAESGKMRFLVGLLDNLKETGHRTLVFSRSSHVLDIIQKVMRNKDHKLVRVDGQIKKEERQEIIDKFKEDPSITLFLLTTQVGGEGLTLTAADRVVVFDPSWNPATDSQAVDRVHRIGQTREVVVYRLITCGTVEEKIYCRQIFKDTINRLVTGDSINLPRYFSQEELTQIFELGDFKSSATQVELEQRHSGKRITDRQLDNHLTFIYSLGMFGISDHDLMFTTDADDDNVYDEEAMQRATMLPAAAGLAASAAAAGGESSSAWNESSVSSMSSVAWPASVSARPAGLSMASTAVRPMAPSTQPRPRERQEE